MRMIKFNNDGTADITAEDGSQRLETDKDLVKAYRRDTVLSLKWHCESYPPGSPGSFMAYHLSSFLNPIGTPKLC